MVNAAVTVLLVTAGVSPFCNPEYAGVPVNVALVVPSYALFAPVKPVIVNGAALTTLPLAAAVIFTADAAPLVNTAAFTPL